MKKMVSFSVAMVWLICLSLLIPAAGAQEASTVQIVAAAICKDVVGKRWRSERNFRIRFLGCIALQKW